jgi:hypothetical protein
MEGKVLLQHGTGLDRLCTRASKVATSSKDFILRRIKTQNTLIQCALYVHNTLYFSPLQVKNKPFEGITNVRFLLGL